MTSIQFDRYVVLDNSASLTADGFADTILRWTLSSYPACKHFYTLTGGFNNYQTEYPEQCLSSGQSPANAHRPLLSTMSQPCLPVTNIGPTHIMQHVYLGSQIDSLDSDVLKEKGITYILNVSKTCPPCDSIPTQNFMRIPVMDSYKDQIIPFFNDAFEFLNNVKKCNGCVLIHCYAGISRSATLAIAYVMHEMNFTMDAAYKYVKARRATISPNFNFLGQLIEHERLIREARGERDFIINTDCSSDPLKSQIIDGTLSISDKSRVVNLYRSTSAITPPAKRPMTLARSVSAVTPRPNELPIKSPPRPSFLKLSQSMDFNLSCRSRPNSTDPSPIPESPVSITNSDCKSAYIRVETDSTLPSQLTTPPQRDTPLPQRDTPPSYTKEPAQPLSCKKRIMRPKCWIQAKKWCSTVKSHKKSPLNNSTTTTTLLSAQSPTSALANLRFDSCAVDSPTKTPANVAGLDITSPLRKFNAASSTLEALSFVGCQSTASLTRPKSAIYSCDSSPMGASAASKSIEDVMGAVLAAASDRIPRKSRSYEDILISTSTPPTSTSSYLPNYRQNPQQQNSAHSSQHSSIEMIFCT